MFLKAWPVKPLPLRNAYAAKVCPDCEGWNCAAEEVCDMVEAEDESDVKVPSCSEKQTGCDLDRFELLETFLLASISSVKLLPKQSPLSLEYDKCID